jgi:hypothetical protein
MNEEGKVEQCNYGLVVIERMKMMTTMNTSNSWEFRRVDSDVE